MPFYDWECLQCQNHFETMSSFSEFDRWQKEKTGIKCPKCASENVNKLISKGTSFSLRGSGWTGKLNPKRK